MSKALQAAELPGLRERKAASTRLAIVASLRRRLARTPLSEIHAGDLAADANVSRVTFFNYFATKEHALDYLMAVWLFEVGAAVARRGFLGVAAIVHVFDAMGDSVAESPEAMRRIVAHFASRPTDRPLPALGRAERVVLAPDLDGGVLAPTLGELFMRSVEEARRAGELDAEGTTYEIAHFLGALLHGSVLVGHSSADTDWKRLIRRHVRRGLGLGFAAGAGRAAVGPPATPARYRRSKKGGGR